MDPLVRILLVLLAFSMMQYGLTAIPLQDPARGIARAGVSVVFVLYVLRLAGAL